MIKQIEIKTKAIVLSKTHWKESSLLLNILTEGYGILNVLAQGARKPKSSMFARFESGHCLELILKKSVSAQMYKVTDSTLDISSIGSLSYPQLLSVQSVLEIVNQLHISTEESKVFYDLICSFLLYIKKIKHNHIFVVWRCLLRLIEILGFPVDIMSCSACSGAIQKERYLILSEYALTCAVCAEKYDENQRIILSQDTNKWLNLIPKAAALCKQNTILDLSIKKVNLFIINYLNFHLHKKFHHKALELYEEYVG